MPIEILEVAFAPSDPEVLWGRHIDLPKSGATVDGERVVVVGWVLGKAEPAVAVELVSGTRVLASLPIDEARPDLAEVFPDVEGAGQSGFRATATLGAAVDLDLTLRAVLESGARIALGTIRASRRWPERAEAPGPALVSVVVTVHDRPEELPDAIDSVLGQTYPHFELVVVDTGSIDHTAEVVRRTPGARLVQADGGIVAAARNAGLAATVGSFVVFMDASDRLLPEALETGLRELATHPDYAFVSGLALVVGDDPNAPMYPQQPFVPDDHYTTLLQGNYILSHAAVMYRRPVLGDVGVFDPELTELSEYDLYLRIARQYPIGSHTARVVEDREYGRRAARATESLAAGLETLRRQEPFVAGDARRERALQLGTRRWRSHWGGPADAQPSDPAGRGPERKKGALRRRRPPPSPETTGPSTPAVGKATLGDLRRLTPVSDNFGFDRGRPVDRYYIEDFLDRRSSDVRGRVLEVQENHYTMRYGAERVTQSEVINLLPGNPRATIVGDLTDSQVLPANAFDCVILTQTLHLIYEARAALQNVRESLRDGGVLLLTTPGISQVEWGEAWYWSFTTLSLKRMLEDVFGPGNVELESHGNVLAATAFLQGLAVEDVAPRDLDYVDLSYPVVLTARATRR